MQLMQYSTPACRVYYSQHHIAFTYLVNGFLSGQQKRRLRDALLNLLLVRGVFKTAFWLL